MSPATLVPACLVNDRDIAVREGGGDGGWRNEEKGEVRMCEGGKII